MIFDFAPLLQVLVYGDCAVNVEPKAEELAQVRLSHACLPVRGWAVMLAGNEAALLAPTGIGFGICSCVHACCFASVAAWI